MRHSGAARGPEWQTKTPKWGCITLFYCKAGTSVRRLVLLAMKKYVNVRLDGWPQQQKNVIEMTVREQGAKARLCVLHFGEELFTTVCAAKHAQSSTQAVTWARRGKCSNWPLANCASQNRSFTSKAVMCACMSITRVNEVGRLGAQSLLVNDAVHLVYGLGVSGGLTVAHQQRNGFAGRIAMLLPSRVAGRTLGLRGPDLARGPEVGRRWRSLCICSGIKKSTMKNCCLILSGLKINIVLVLDRLRCGA